MKTTLFLTALSFFSVSTTLSAQETPTVQINRLNICEVNVYFGTFGQYNPLATLDDFKKLAPQSVLLKGNMSGYSQSQGNGHNSSGMFSVNMGIRFSDKNKTAYRANPLLRLGFTYFNTTNLSSSLYSQTTKRADTLISSQNGQPFYVDSVISRSYYMNYSSQQIRLDASLIFRTDHKARWSFFGGLGVTAGMALNANTYINYYMSGGVQSNTNSYYSYYTNFNGENYKSETFKNSGGYGMSAYVPLGIDFRMGKKRAFWQRTHLFYEFRPGINVTSIPELGSIMGTCLQQGLGIKINWE